TQHREMSHRTAVGKQPSLSLAQPDGDVAKGLAVLVLRSITWHKHHFRALTIDPRIWLPIRSPLLLRNFQNCRVQRLAHPHTDRKTNESLRPACAFLVR